MKKMMIAMLLMLLAGTSAFAQVKTFVTVVEDELLTVNASDSEWRVPDAHRVWVRYDYHSPKDCKKAAKLDGIFGKAVRAELLYEYDEYLLKYRILRKVYYDKNNREIGVVHYDNASWNSIGDMDYSLKIGIYMTGAFHIVAG